MKVKVCKWSRKKWGHGGGCVKDIMSAQILTKADMAGLHASVSAERQSHKAHFKPGFLTNCTKGQGRCVQPVHALDTLK